MTSGGATLQTRSSDYPRMAFVSSVLAACAWAGLAGCQAKKPVAGPADSTEQQATAPPADNRPPPPPPLRTPPP